MKESAPTVYIVDDDNGVRSSIRVLMKSVGLPATTFASAQEFLAALSPEPARLPGARHPHARA